MKTRIRLVDTIVLTLVVLLVAFMLAPAVARLQRSPADAKCQSNLRRWAQAMALYVRDNQGKYPTNRATYSCYLLSSIQLTPDGALNPDGTQKRFQYGVNWVEALYPYVQAGAAATGQDWQSVRQCPNARNAGEKPGGLWATSSRMTYSFNYNLVEQPESLVRGPGSLMMFREMDRRVNSVLRPANLSCDAVSMPDTAFLGTADNYVTPDYSYSDRHGSGSYIAFADGHVRYFTTEYYPKTCMWDSDTLRWYNYVYPNPADDTQRRLNKSIAVSP